MRSARSAKARRPPGAAAGEDREELAIRFVNTAAWRLRAAAEERLPDAEALLTWLGRNGIAITGRNGARVRSADAKARQIIHGAAIALREAIYHILIARMAGTAPPVAALELFNRHLARANTGTELAWRPGAIAWRASLDIGATDVLKPVVISAAALMTGPRAGQVKQCEDDRGCGWLFVDESRAQNRRWCAMGDCGNRAKAQRHYNKVRRKT